MTDKMRVALGQHHTASDDYLTFASQLGVSGVQLNLLQTSGALSIERGILELDELVRLRARVEARGLRLEAIENLPQELLVDAMLGLAGRDDRIADYQRTLRNMGQAGIRVLGLHWMPNSVWRTAMATGRGGVRVTAWDGARAEAGEVTAGTVALPQLAGRTVSADEMFANYVAFMEQVLPVAEEAGVRIAVHPDDPPVAELGGIARIFHAPDGYRRAFEALPSPSHGLGFCMGTFSEMAYPGRASGAGVLDALREFGERDRIVYMHFRDVQGRVPRFQECFPGEGNVDVVAAMRTLKEVGFSGFIIDDHVPAMLDDSDWRHRGHAYATGYIMALVAAVERLG